MRYDSVSLYVDVETIDNVIRNRMKSGKAAGYDNLTFDHILLKTNGTNKMTGDLLMDSFDNDSVSIGCIDFGAGAVSYTHLTLPTNREV